MASTRGSGRRLDWIAVSKSWDLQSAGIDHNGDRGGLTPSDHFAITAVVRAPD